MIDDETQKMLMDFGALGYSEAQMRAVTGWTEKELTEVLMAGGRDQIAQGAAQYQFLLDRKLMEMAAAGDMKAMEKIDRDRRMRSA